MVDSTSAEFPVELFSTEGLEVVNGVRPKMKHVIARKTVPLLHHHNAGA